MNIYIYFGYYLIARKFYFFIFIYIYFIFILGPKMHRVAPTLSQYIDPTSI